MYAFLSHETALDVLRSLGAEAMRLPRWPAEPRELPRHRNTVTTQRGLKEYAATVDLASYGATRSPIDLLVPKAEQRSRGKGARFHAWKRPLPTQSLIRLEESLFVSTPEFAIVQMAGWHARQEPVIEDFARELRDTQEAEALVGLEGPTPYDDPIVWNRMRLLLRMVLMMMELMGSYRLPTPTQGTRYQQPALMSAESLEGFMAGVDRLYGANRLHDALALALPHSASPMETALALMLSLPECYGGYGLPQPTLNRELPVRDHELLWYGGPAITPDLLWEDAKLLVEYDSDEEHGSTGPRKLANDATRANVLTALGYSVLRATTLNVQTLADVDRLAQQVASGLGIELPKPDDVLRIRRTKLHRLLMTH